MPMTTLPAKVREARKQLARVGQLARALDRATDPQEIIKIDALLNGIETTMRESGLYSTAEIRPVNETRMWARWKLGRALDKIERRKPGPKGKIIASPGLTQLLKSLGLSKQTAMESHRIGTLPEPELKKTLDKARASDDLITFAELIDLARPYWYQASRKTKHRKIAALAKGTMKLGNLGPFPLIYADPPWKFEVYSSKGLDRTADQHYPTLTDKEIENFRVERKLVRDIANADAALLMWCTSSNLVRALSIMQAWGFEYKTQAVWDKTVTGLGLVFRNQHEILLYGTRGKMPGPQYQPPSVFRFPRGRHSAKPPQIRTEIERMYPDFDARTRLELFTRETVQGWTPYGYEQYRDAAE